MWTSLLAIIGSIPCIIILNTFYGNDIKVSESQTNDSKEKEFEMWEVIFMSTYHINLNIKFYSHF